MSEENLESLLNDDPVEETPEEVEEAPEEVTEEDASTDEQEAAPSAAIGEDQEGLTEREKAYYAKAQDEKRKRQELEKQLETKAEPEKVPDPVDDPEGYAKYLDAKNQQTQWATRVTISQEMMREKHADYDEKEAAFMEMAKDDPGLISRLRSASNPAKFAYEAALKHERMSQYDNFDDAVKGEVEKQVAAAREQITAELEKKYEGMLKDAKSLPPSGAAGSLGSDDTTTAHESLSDILGN